MRGATDIPAADIAVEGGIIGIDVRDDECLADRRLNPVRFHHTAHKHRGRRGIFAIFFLFATIRGRYFGERRSAAITLRRPGGRWVCGWASLALAMVLVPFGLLVRRARVVDVLVEEAKKTAIG